MVTKLPFGQISETVAGELYKIECGSYSASVTNYGATLVSFTGPDKNGNKTDVALGFDSVEPYLGKVGSMGSVVGRFGNRIEKGLFTLGGKEYKLDINNGPNHLHGGLDGFARRTWNAIIIDDNAVEFSMTSPDGDQGYPGELKVKVTYSLSSDGALSIDYFAVSDSDTVINLTNHAYFNLNGVHKESNILDHVLWLDASAFCETDADCLANGNILATRGTPFDFTNGKKVGEALSAENFQPLIDAKGIDHNFCIGNVGEFKLYGSVYSEESGITMKCYTDQPGVQIYTGNFMHEWVGKAGVKYSYRGGICLETQGYPNSTTHKHFPTPILKANQEYRRKTVYQLCI